MTLLVLTCLVSQTRAFLPPSQPELPDFDIRATAKAGNISPEQQMAASSLKSRLPSARIDFDAITGSPKSISAKEGFLSGSNDTGKAISPATASGFPPGDKYKAAKAFLREHRQLFGFGPETLDKAWINRDFATPHNGLRTVVWEQHLQGIAVFEAVFISHTTKQGELVNVSSQFIPDAEAAARATPARTITAPEIPATRALIIAAANVGQEITGDVKPIAAKGSLIATSDPQKHQRFIGKGLKGDAQAKLIWLPMGKSRLSLCWDVVLTTANNGQMFRILVDAATGELLLRHALTEYISDATYRIFASDSPTPMSPGWSMPNSTQPPYVPSTLVTISAFDTNASPTGWIDDGVTETLGNNVDAHTDHDDDNLPDLPRPDGGTNRVFDFTMNLSTDDPTNYIDAAVVNVFYWCNWMHDKLYAMGFTEAAGNFQTTNFGRGGVEGDPVLADAQDGGGFNNANFSTGPDGSPGRIQLYLFPGASPRRDGSLDVEVILHEYTHGLSNRRVGGGALISALQSRGMGEGWSDFFALSLLSDPSDDPNANYAMGAYVARMLLGSLTQNYYYGVRRYPYTTDVSKNPLTLKDVDPTQASSHSGVPRSPVIGSTAYEIHNQGEVWCVTLWDARAKLIARYGAAAGNELMLRLVTDGMNLSPPNPNFLQARDAILQADLVDTGGTNQFELWTAFARRGMGLSAAMPDSSITTGVHEAFDYPDDLRITPKKGFISSGPVAGPFTPTSSTLTLTNLGTNSLGWGLTITSSWLTASSPAGLIPAHSNDRVNIGVDDSATNLAAGIYFGSVLFTNSSSTNLQARQFILKVGQPDPFTEIFDANDNDIAFRRFTFTPDASTNFYSVCQEVANAFPTDPTGGTPLILADDSFATVTLSGTNTVAIYGTRTNVLFIGSNGYLTMNDGDITYNDTAAAHFNLPRISGLFHDLNPEVGGTISRKELDDRFVVTYQNISQYGSGQGNNFQIEMFFDGRLRITWLSVGCLNGLVGLSAGTGVPPVFVESDLSHYSFCPPPGLLVEPVSQILKPGTNVIFRAVAVGAEPLMFQWQKNGTNLADGGRISGVTSSNLNIVSLVEDDSGSYRVTVTNNYGTITSSNAVLAVTAVDHFFWAHIPAPQSARVPFTIALEARDSSDLVATNFNSHVSFTATNNGLTLTPTVSGAFSNGVWTGPLTVGSSATNVELIANDGLGHTGTADLSVAAAPQLQIQSYTNNFYILWTAGALLKLETTTNLDSPVWIELQGATQAGDQYILPFTTDDPVRFYRLRY